MNWFRRTAEDPTKLRAVMERVWPIIIVFADTLNDCEPGPSPMSALPYPKSVISDALMEWLTLLAKPATRRTVAANWPAHLERVSSPASVDWLVGMYVSLSCYLPDRDASLLLAISAGRVDELSSYDLQRGEAIRAAFMYDRGDRELKLQQLGYVLHP